MTIKIIRCTDPLAWYADRIGQTIEAQRLEIRRSPTQGIPEDVYWCRTGDLYNTLNFVRRSDAEETSLPPPANPSASPKFVTLILRVDDEKAARTLVPGVTVAGNPITAFALGDALALNTALSALIPPEKHAAAYAAERKDILPFLQ